MTRGGGDAGDTCKRRPFADAREITRQCRPGPRSGAQSRPARLQPVAPGPRISAALRPGRQRRVRREPALSEAEGGRAFGQISKLLPITSLFSLTYRFLSPISVSVNARTAPAAVSGRPQTFRMSIPLPPRSGGTRRRLPCPAGRVSQPGSRFPFGMPGLRSAVCGPMRGRRPLETGANACFFRP